MHGAAQLMVGIKSVAAGLLPKCFGREGVAPAGLTPTPSIGQKGQVRLRDRQEPAHNCTASLTQSWGQDPALLIDKPWQSTPSHPGKPHLGTDNDNLWPTAWEVPGPLVPDLQVPKMAGTLKGLPSDPGEEQGRRELCARVTKCPGGVGDGSTPLRALRVGLRLGHWPIRAARDGPAEGTRRPRVLQGRVVG